MYCFCGDQTPVVFDIRPEIDCDSDCPGDKSIKCGGQWRLSVYKTGAAGLQHEYLGCYSDNEDRKLKGVHQEFSVLTPRICIDYCKERRFVYAGLQNKTHCYCGNDVPASSDKQSEGDCDMDCPADYTVKCGGRWRNSVYKTIPVNGTPISEEIPGIVVTAETTSLTDGNIRGRPLLDYVGCYADDLNRRIRGEYTSDTGMSPQMCIEICKNKSYVYAVSIQHEYLGCYRDDVDRKLKGGTEEIATLTPRICIDRCKEKGYIYAGLQSTIFCLCGNETMSASERRPEAQCDTTCPGDYTRKCGGPWRNSVYKTKPVDKIDTPVECRMSATTVNNQPVCANTVVFEEHFDTISQVKWKRLVQIPSHPEYQFVIYNSSPDNSFTTNGKLVIKTLFLTDSQVKYGNLELAECTGERFTSECGYKARSFSILPPVQTARLTTRNSFAFRYGKLEMTAKLPMGDWLVPELWLEPKNNVYGPAYASSRIRLAMSRGNRNLKINGQEIGCKQLESGVLVSFGDDIRNRTIIRKTQDCWYNSYHNYSLVWTPDNIIFTIDGGTPQVLIPNDDDTLSDVIGFPSGINHPWKSTVRIAPFDQEFYIVVGLSVGGMKEFPDNCVNSGRPKPWRNFELKAMLNFWKNQNSWKPTWQEDTALLQIDCIKVTAL